MTVAVLENFDASHGPQDAYFSDVREALRERAAENMMSLTFFPDVRALIEAGEEFSGFVSLGPAPMQRADLAALHEVLPHGVFIDINPAPALFHSLRPDLQQTVIDAIYALREQGRNRIAFIGGDGHMMGSHVFAQDPRTVAFNEWARLLHMENGRRQAEELLDAAGDELPDAILVAADSLAVGVLQTLFARKVRVPDQVAVLSIDNLEICEYTAPPLSSYAIESSELAETALMLLSDSIVGRFQHKHHILLSTRLVARQSFVPAQEEPDS